MSDYLRGKRVLVTGGTGSLGRALVPKLLEAGAHTVRILSRGEHAQADMRAALAEHADRLRFLLGDVRDLRRLTQAFHEVDAVVHAAALKRVEAAEYDPDEFRLTNVDGTANAVHAAIAANVERFLFVSTDKSVQPLVTYGLTKALAETIVLTAAPYVGARRSRFAVVRYGNVGGSAGSVIPLWRRQAAAGGPITVTDPSMTRFHVSLPDAADFVVRSLCDMRGGEVMVPKLPSLRVSDLAEAVAPGVERKIIGVREREKLHEVLISEDDASRTWDDGNRYVVSASFAGFRVQPGFRYASNTNTEWLDVSALREIVHQ